MDAFHHVTCIDEYAVLKLLYMNNLQVTTLLEMVCFTYQHVVLYIY